MNHPLTQSRLFSLILIFKNQESFLNVLQRIESLDTELEVAIELEKEMIKIGAQGRSFDTIVANGKNSAIQHYRTGNIHIKKEEALLIDWGARYCEYNSDLTRIIIHHKIDTQIEKIINCVKDALNLGISLLKPGIRASDIDREVRSFFERYNLEKYFLQYNLLIVYF
ncbi:MAG: M24 family metallopeptidase [Candidatus Asgardarchaeia archaeon]